MHIMVTWRPLYGGGGRWWRVAIAATAADVLALLLL